MRISDVATFRSLLGFFAIAMMTLASGCASGTKSDAACVDCEQTAGIVGEFNAWPHFGMEATLDQREPICPGMLINQEKTGPVMVAGEIQEVCQAKGCWMMIGEGDHLVRITFKDYAFFVPKNAAGHRAVVIGEAKRVERDVETLRHFAEDGGASPEEIAAITEPEQVIEIVAESVYIEGDDLEEPHTP